VIKNFFSNFRSIYQMTPQDNMAASETPSRVHHLVTILANLVSLGSPLLDDSSRVVRSMACAVAVDQIILQFEILSDDIQNPSFFPGILQRSRGWLEQLLGNLQTVLNIFKLLALEDPTDDSHDSKYDSQYSCIRLKPSEPLY
jgi:hypothetical protein